MSNNYNSTLQSNNTDLQEVLQTLQTKAAGGQATPVISVSSNGLITATAGTKSSTHQLAFQAAKTITPTTASQIAVSSGYYTGGNITVASVPTQTKTATPTSATQNITPDSGKFLSKVTVNGDANLVAGNIKSGISIFGVNGNYVGSGGSSGSNSDAENGLVARTITSYINDSVTSIGDYAFYSYSNLTSISCPQVTSIGPNAFYLCSRLTDINFPNVTTIGSSAFQQCSSLAAANFPKMTYIPCSCFNSCKSLSVISFPQVKTIGSWAFQGCSKLSIASFPNATFIGNYAFELCGSLWSVNIPKATSICSGAFVRCSQISSVHFSKATYLGSCAFQLCSNLTEVSFSVVQSIGSSAFVDCSKLTSVNFPKATTIHPSAFGSCIGLTTASFGSATYIGSSAFNKCYNLKSLYLTGNSVCTLSNSNAFSSTPIGGYLSSANMYGSIYVPATLLNSYRTATNWTYFSSRFAALTNHSGGAID